MEDQHLLDMSVLRSKLLAAQDRLRDGEHGEAAELLAQVVAMLNPRLDPHADHPSIDPAAVTKAITAAHEALLSAGLQNPVELLIVQTHDVSGKTTGRTLATNAANPQDLLRRCLRNVERNLRDGPRGSRTLKRR